MHVRDVIEQMETIAPLGLAEEWDNVGLLVGSEQQRVRRVLLTIDLTSAVLAEAIKADVGLIIAYHPPIFHPLKRLTDATTRERLVLEAARHEVSIYSPHTALDAAEGGVNDWLASGLGSGDVRALKPWGNLPMSEETKIITFCPCDAAERLRNGLSAIGAGNIGEYAQCSFETRGTGTFRGGEGTDPATGSPGHLEHVDEVRLEMVCPNRALALAVATIRNFHPYEEPPIEIHPLQPRPERGRGPGRRVVLDQPATLDEVVERVRKTIGSKRMLASTGQGTPRRRYDIIGLCAGAGGSLVDCAIDEGCQLYLTGEMSHHDVLRATSGGCTVVLAGHTNTERGYLRILRRRLGKAMPSGEFAIAKRDRDPLRLV